MNELSDQLKKFKNRTTKGTQGRKKELHFGNNTNKQNQKRSQELLKNHHSLGAWILQLDLIHPTGCVASDKLLLPLHSSFMELVR